MLNYPAVKQPSSRLKIQDRKLALITPNGINETKQYTFPTDSLHIPIFAVTLGTLITMAPLTPHWQQPSHPDIQEVIINEAEFSSKSLSKVALPPFAVYAKLSFPPCTIAAEPTYATVQMGRDSHLSLNSDLLFINHSCEPSLVSECAPSFRLSYRMVSFTCVELPRTSTPFSIKAPTDC